MYKGRVLIAVVALIVLGSSNSFAEAACSYKIVNPVNNQEGTTVIIAANTLVHYNKQTLYIDKRWRYTPGGKGYWENFRKTVDVPCNN